MMSETVWSVTISDTAEKGKVRSAIPDAMRCDAM